MSFNYLYNQLITFDKVVISVYDMSRYSSKNYGFSDAELKIVKDIDTKIRSYFSPLALSQNIVNPQGKKVLLVDDLLTTGTTLISAKELLAGNNVSSFQGLCLLSSL